MNVLYAQSRLLVKTIGRRAETKTRTLAGTRDNRYRHNIGTGIGVGTGIGISIGMGIDIGTGIGIGTDIGIGQWLRQRHRYRHRYGHRYRHRQKMV